MLGDVGPWSDRLYLAGGLAPRYLIGQLPRGARPHVGTTDVDFVVTLAMPNEEEAYRTLERNLRDSGFKLGKSSFQWRRDVDGTPILVEFLCETKAVERGRIHRPKSGEGSKFAALNIEGAELAARDFVTVSVKAERLDGGGLSEVEARIANLLPYVVLKIQSFQDRHENKDAYDLVFTLRNWPGGPGDAGAVAASSPVAADALVARSVDLLAERFGSIDHDGSAAYASFLANASAEDDNLRREAVAVVGQFVGRFGSSAEA